MELAASYIQPHSDSQQGLHFPPRRILVVIDPTAYAQPALYKAVTIATRCGARLELYVCDEEQRIPESWAGGARSEEYRELRRKRLLEELAALAQPLIGSGLRVDLVCEWHAPLEQGIAEHVIRTQPDLVVKETHRHVPLARAGLSHTDWNLVRIVPAPLLLVRARPWPSTIGIAAAIDPCHPADRPVALDASIVEGSRALAGIVGGTLEVYHVLQIPPHLPGDRVSLEQVAGAHLQARGAVEQLATSVGAGARFIEGQVPEALVQLTGQHRPDILVMGAVARPRSADAAAGGMAARMLERVDCDLLVVKPPGFVSPMLVSDQE